MATHAGVLWRANSDYGSPGARAHTRRCREGVREKRRNNSEHDERVDQLASKQASTKVDRAGWKASRAYERCVQRHDGLFGGGGGKKRGRRKAGGGGFQTFPAPKMLRVNESCRQHSARLHMWPGGHSEGGARALTLHFCCSAMVCCWIICCSANTRARRDDSLTYLSTHMPRHCFSLSSSERAWKVVMQSLKQFSTSVLK
mmetsp:Transcript_47244/g.118978  ORF Transcript_47244/g.118978 Transcript_47244/m.118978 type:complete len:201 (+) Transcript_47244:103-705(+)